MSREAFCGAWRCQVDDDLYAHASYAAQLGAIIAYLNHPDAPASGLEHAITQRPASDRYDRHDAARPRARSDVCSIMAGLSLARSLSCAGATGGVRSTLTTSQIRSSWFRAPVAGFACAGRAT